MSSTADWVKTPSIRVRSEPATLGSLTERAIEAEKDRDELQAQVTNLHIFLDELWTCYKINSTLRQRILAAKAQRWDTALLGIHISHADRELITKGSTAYANRTVVPGTEHSETAFEETGESFGI